MQGSDVISGASTEIHPSVVMMSDGGRRISVGDNTKILRGAEILGPVTIGSSCFINRDAYIRAETTIGDNVAMGPFCRLITDSHHIGTANRRAGKNKTDPIRIGKGTWIGASVTILGGVTVGSGCVIAAGSMVTKDVPDNTIVAGVPAKIVRNLDAPPQQPSPWQRIAAKLSASSKSRPK